MFTIISVRVWHTLLDLFYPRDCLGCGHPVGAGDLRYLCPTCCDELIEVKHYCAACGSPTYVDAAGDGVCARCRASPSMFGRGRTCFVFETHVRAMIHELKYSAGLHLVRDLSVLISKIPEMDAFLSHCVLVPVPLHPRKLRERGFNQSELLAHVLARRYGTHVSNCLIKVRDTPSQTFLDCQARADNVKNAFALKHEVSDSQRYVLLDDVLTTGATLNECAKTLRAGGAKYVDVFTLAHG